MSLSHGNFNMYSCKDQSPWHSSSNLVAEFEGVPVWRRSPYIAEQDTVDWVCLSMSFYAKKEEEHDPMQEKRKGASSRRQSAQKSWLGVKLPTLIRHLQLDLRKVMMPYSQGNLVPLPISAHFIM